jgi:hypothetical protein
MAAALDDYLVFHLVAAMEHEKDHKKVVLMDAE